MQAAQYAHVWYTGLCHMQAAYAVLIDNMRVCITCKLPSVLIPDMQACAACKLSRAPIPDKQGFCRQDLCIHCFLPFIIWRYCLDFLLSAIWSTLHVYIPFHGNHSTLSSPSYSRPNLCFHYVKEMCRTMTLVPPSSYKGILICPAIVRSPPHNHHHKYSSTTEQHDE